MNEVREELKAINQKLEWMLYGLLALALILMVTHLIPAIGSSLRNISANTATELVTPEKAQNPPAENSKEAAEAAPLGGDAAVQSSSEAPTDAAATGAESDAEEASDSTEMHGEKVDPNAPGPNVTVQSKPTKNKIPTKDKKPSDD